MVAFDTNVVFYAVNQDSPFHAAARAFLASLEESPEVAVSELMLVEIYRLLRNPTVNRAPLGAAATTQVIEAFRRHPHWRLVGFPADGRGVHDRLWKWAAQPGVAYRRIFDARLAFSLVAQGVSDFATVNLADFEGFGFRRVWNPLAAARA